MTLAGRTDIDYCYIMTDLVDANIDYWKTNQQLLAHCEKGRLDFAKYNINKSETLHLKLSKQNITPNTLKNPLIVIANYVFDSIAHDAWVTRNGEARIAKISVYADESNLIDGRVVDLDQLKIDVNYDQVDIDLIQHPGFSHILHEYLRELPYGSFMLPTAGILWIDRLRELTKNRLVMLVGDKGHTDREDLVSEQEHAAPDIAFHGSFSLNVNFDALQKYTQLVGGDSRIAKHALRFSINLFSFGLKSESVHGFHWYYDTHIARLSVINFVDIKRHFQENPGKHNLHELIAVLKLSRWDPDVFCLYSRHIVQELEDGHAEVIRELVAGVEQVIRNTYLRPGGDNTFLEIGRVYLYTNQLSQAVDALDRSVVLAGANAESEYLRGVAAYTLGQQAQAIEYFKESLILEPNAEYSQTNRDHIESAFGIALTV